MFYWHLRLPGVKNSAHLEPHRLDSDRVGTPGASGSAHLRVGGFATLQVRTDLRTWELVVSLQGVLLALMTSRCEILRILGTLSFW